MPYAEEDLLPISALQHLLFCERQCALIHVERLWDENRWTAEGAVLHRKAHEGKPETRDGERVARGLPLRSLELGLSGVADVVLYRPPGGTRRRNSMSAALREASPEELALWEVTPIEYKRGRPKKHDADRVQLCAQALCLEEVHGLSIPRGALFYGRTRRRQEVRFDDALRVATRRAAARFRQIVDERLTPPAVREKKCESCSLLPHCLPSMGRRKSARDFLRRQLVHLVAEANSEDVAE